MEVLDNLLTRRSVRKFADRQVEEELLCKVIEAGLYAASGGGRQPSAVVAVTNREIRDELAAMNAAVMGREGTDPFYGAPAVLVVLSDRSSPTAVYDGSLMLGNMMNAAHALGLGTCWIHRAKQMFDSERGKEILRSCGLEGDYEGIGNLIIGYPADDELPKAADRKPGRVFFIR